MLPADVLVSNGFGISHFPPRQGDRHVTRRIEPNRRQTVVRQPDGCRVRPRPNDERVLQGPIVPGERKVDTWVKPMVDDALIRRDIRSPAGWVAANEVIELGRRPFHPGRPGARLRPGEMYLPSRLTSNKGQAFGGEGQVLAAGPGIVTVPRPGLAQVGHEVERRRPKRCQRSPCDGIPGHRVWGQ